MTFPSTGPAHSDNRSMALAGKVSALKRFIFGLASGGAYPVAESFEKEMRIAERDERRNSESEQTDDDA